MTRKDNIRIILISLLVIAVSLASAFYFADKLAQNPDWVYHPKEAHQEQISLEWLKWGFCAIAVVTFFNLIRYLTYKHYKAL